MRHGAISHRHGELHAVAKEVDEIHIAANNNRSSFAPKTAEWLTAALLAKAERIAAEKQSELPLAN